MKFCPECQSMLYYIEEDEILYENCKTCGYKVESEDRVIETNIYKAKLYKGMENNQYFIYDPTLPRTIHQPCPNPQCPSQKDKKLQEAVFYNNPDTMKLSYICCVCRVQWKL